MVPSETTEHPLEFHGGLLGALAPFLVFLGGVATLAFLGAPSEKGFWPVLVAGLFVGMLLARDREAWANAVIEAMSQRVVMIMILAWLLAGALGSVLGASGLVDAMVWAASALGVHGGGYVVAAFLICCVVSTSTGTSLGTVIVTAPLIYPTGGALGADPVILMGAILGGATFGDNISPVSDTTIASAMSQGAEMSAVVRSRLKYAIPAALLSIVAYAALGGAAPTDRQPSIVEETTVQNQQSKINPNHGSLALTKTGTLPTPPLPAAAGSPKGLPMLIAPALVLFLLLRRRHLLEGLLAGLACACLVGVATGLLEPSQLMSVDASAYSAKGLLVEGIDRGIGVSVFTLLLMGIVGPVEASGLTNRAIRFAEQRTHSKASAERWTVASVSIAALLITHTTVAILTVGDFARRLGERFGIGPARRANLLDVMACSWPHVFPWFIPAILTAGTTLSGEPYGMPRLSSVQVGLANFHSLALLFMVLLAVFFGYGRRHDDSPPPSV